MPSKAASKPFEIHILSDATGGLASHMTQSVLTQFPKSKFRITFHLFVKSEEDVRKHVGGLQGKQHLLLHRLIRPGHKELLRDLCEGKGIPEYDVTGGLTDFIAKHTGLEPFLDPKRLHIADEHYFRRIEAMEFTAQHDDNRRMDTLDEADIVIVGLSRVSKSPTSTWLGSMGYKVGNVAIAPETGFPKELDPVRDRTVAFTTRPRELWNIRRRRFDRFKEKISEQEIEQLPYYDLRSIVSEVAWAEKEFRKRSYPIVDISGQTVEEVAARVVTLLKPESEDILHPKFVKHDD
jgi:regulator of PEP synthase PpsR (kinase-PPPase family)